MRSCLLLIFVQALIVVTTCGVPASLRAQAVVDDAENFLALSEDEMPAEAALCGIGIAAAKKADAASTPAASGAADPVLPAPVTAIGKWVAGLIGSHIQKVITRQLGMDKELSLLELSKQLRVIEAQLAALDEKFDRLGDQMKVTELRQRSSEFAQRFVDPVRNGMHYLHTLTCEEAAVANAERMERDTADLRLDLKRAEDAFSTVCTPKFADIARDITMNFRSSESILDRYLEAVILPRRYLVHQDSVELENFLRRYQLVQIEALLLTAECDVRFSNTGLSPDDEKLRESVANSVYRKQSSHFHSAKMDVLEQILPDQLPDGVVFDAQTKRLWWNGTEYGVHPFVNRSELVKDHTISLQHDVGKPEEGVRRFELAKAVDVVSLASLDRPWPVARRERSESGRYPSTLKPFLRAIGLDKVAEDIHEKGNLSYVWTSDIGKPIRRCKGFARMKCISWDEGVLGTSAGTIPGSSKELRLKNQYIWWAPEQCVPDGCTRYWDKNPGIVSLCTSRTERDEWNRCIPDTALGLWQAPGIYVALPRPKERFFAFDMSKLKSAEPRPPPTADR